MAKPRVFISSTFYDLRHVRAELERFVIEMGYEPVLNERGSIPYGATEALEEYCYQEVEKVDILVSIIGGRFGSQSKTDQNHSISQMEIKAALQRNKQVYLFIEAGVHSEYQIYTMNKNKDIVFSHVDDKRIHQFLEELYSLPHNNQIATFDGVPAIIGYLREQWAGLLQRSLQQRSQEQMFQAIQTLKSTADTLKSLVDILKTQQSAPGEEMGRVIDSFLLPNHPVFQRIRDLLGVSYRIFFSNLGEMKEWLMVRGYNPVEEELWFDDDTMEFLNQPKNKDGFMLCIQKDIFDEHGNLRMLIGTDWNPDSVYIREMRPKTTKATSDLDDEIPF